MKGHRITIRLSKKDSVMKGFLKLIRSKGASISSYSSFAISYYMKNNSFINIADVIPSEDETLSFFNITIDAELATKIDVLADKSNHSRGYLIKAILLNCIQTSQEESLMEEKDFINPKYIEIEKKEAVSVDIRKETQKKEEIIEAVEIKPDKKEDVPVLSNDNSFITNFFPTMMQDIGNWD